jgi:hypothetical protein
MQGIFISYRRQGRCRLCRPLYDRLAGHFGAERVFMDVEGIEPGVDFVEAIDRAVAFCEVLIVIIGAETGLPPTARASGGWTIPRTSFTSTTAAALARTSVSCRCWFDGAVMPREDRVAR